ncbi:breakpoint cluster region protein-like [Varanus komodoensis]|uniref:breakpoint cluster region protein-like n=1 Tax=Varanus komodoensis TaxID=61221 RepID=UPI001CF773F8|nr:breakpoint cluster region protein-like [Varanus komodoensis]
MVDPVGFAEAWRAQFADSEPPQMALRSVSDIEAELECCKASIRSLELEVNKERFRMIYLQTLLAKERKSYDRQRWGFERASRGAPDDQAGGGEDHDRGDSEEAAAEPPAHARPPPSDKPPRPRPPALRKLSAHGDCSEADHPALGDGGGEQERGTLAAADERLPREAGLGSSAKARQGPGAGGGGGSSGRRRRLLSAGAEKEGARDLARQERGGGAAPRSGFERARRPAPPQAAAEKPLYANLEYHHEKGLVKVNDKEVPRHISSLGSQAMQLEARRRLPAPPRGRSAEGDADYEDAELNARFLREHLLPLPPPDAWPGPPDSPPCQGALGGGAAARAAVPVEGDPPGGGRGAALLRQGAAETSLTWPRCSYSPPAGSFEDGGGGGYTPDCSSNENLTSSEEDFSSGQSSHVSPSPTSTCRLYRAKSRSPSQQSFDSGSSPPTPQSQQRRRQQQQVGAPEVAVAGIPKIWACESDLPAPRPSPDSCFHGDSVCLE